MNTEVPYRAQIHGLGNVQNQPITAEWFEAMWNRLYATRRQPDMTGDNRTHGAVPQMTINAAGTNQNFTVQTQGTQTITFGNMEQAAPELHWTQQTNPLYFAAEPVTYRNMIPRRAQRPLDIHPLLRDNTPPQPKPVMSEDAKAFWRGDHFHFDCK